LKLSEITSVPGKCSESDGVQDGEATAVAMFFVGFSISIKSNPLTIQTQTDGFTGKHQAAP
jgi:hypothetical protein